MRFEPKIVRPSELPIEASPAAWTEEAFEAGLPGDLEALAAQLRDDASRLAKVYPAECYSAPCEAELSTASVQTPVRKSRRVVLAWSAAGTLASVLLAAAVSLPWVLPMGGQAERVAEQAAPAGNVGGLGPSREPGLNALVNVSAEHSERHEPGRSPAATPALFLQNVSGPELEGLFDLWEEDAIEQNRISI